jgi:putative transposase
VARSLRVEYPGAYYHVMARGNRREDIFLDEDDRGFFLQNLLVTRVRILKAVKTDCLAAYEKADQIRSHRLWRSRKRC